MADIDARLREDVHLLGELLGQTIRNQYGQAFLDKVELIRQGAKLVETASDITDELGGGPMPAARGTQAAPAALPDHPVLDALGFDPLHLDAIQARCALSTGELQAQLLELELQGRIARLDDGRYQRLK